MNKAGKNRILKNLYKLKYMGYNYQNKIIIKQKVTTGDLPNDLNALESIVLNCNLCSFANSRTNILFGEGKPSADILFVSLSPSALEDESGSLLYGNVGSMFTKIATNILDLDIENIYVLDVLKCMPTKDERNIMENLKICKSYFYKQLDIIKPKIIVVFGEAYNYLTNDQKELSEIRGVMQNFNGIKLMPTYHPSFILRNPSLKQDVLHDLQKVKILMESL